jgi:predicted nucleic acid-binding protein
LIAADTSSVIAWLAGAEGRDVDAIDGALRAADLVLPPPVVSELLAKPGADETERLLQTVRVLPIVDGFWARAGRTRRQLLVAGYRAPLADALIAQACLDADVALITRDSDYGWFAELCGLKLV